MLPPPTLTEIRGIVVDHLTALYEFYGEPAGVRIARKHISWYCRDYAGGREFCIVVNNAQTAHEQLALTKGFFDQMAAEEEVDG